jgi:nitrogen PTS system EIIA component
MRMTMRDATKFFGVSERAIRRWIEEAGLPAHRLDERYHFNRAELLQWANARHVKVASSAFEEEGTPTASLADALRAGGVFHGLEGKDKAAVFREMVKRMPLPPEADREFLLAVLLAREALESTGLGDGVAVPHARDPIVLRVAKPFVTLCFTARPLEFEAIDGKPVSALFAMVCPTPKSHLQMLSRLAFALRDGAFAEAVREKVTADELIARARRVDEALSNPRAAGA